MAAIKAAKQASAAGRAPAGKRAAGKKAAGKQPGAARRAGGPGTNVKKCGRRASGQPRESAAEKTARAGRIVAALRKRYPRATTALHYGAPHELLISTVLAAQCTDKKVNEITETLFKKYRSPEDFARAKRPTLEKEIRQSGFFRAKAKAIVELSRDIVERFGGKVPGTLEELTSLRGVGRKTANVVLSAVFGKPGVIVDTHMMRVAARLGLTGQTDPTKIEFELMEVLPRKDWGDFSFMVVLHGRETCKARRPLCGICPIERMCPSSTLRCGA